MAAGLLQGPQECPGLFIKRPSPGCSRPGLGGLARKERCRGDPRKFFSCPGAPAESSQPLSRLPRSGPPPGRILDPERTPGPGPQRAHCPGEATPSPAEKNYRRHTGSPGEALSNSGKAGAKRSLDLARLLLARNPSSLAALQFLLEKTSEPDLIIPRLHYLGRLSRIKPEDATLREELATLRKLLLGT